VDFTPLAQRLPPAVVVGILNQLSSRFDALVELYGLEKIKTIGDCYMAAAGVPDPRPDHARRAALLALDMRNAVATSGVAGQSGLELRIGINSGPVIAGVIGTKRFLYDLWGDAVNTASRMESQGSPGEIQITSETYELLKDEFVCTRRGTILVKGKGEMETWYLVGPRSDDRRTERGIESEAAGAPPPRPQVDPPGSRVLYLRCCFVGAGGFEPPASCSQTRNRAGRLPAERFLLAGQDQHQKPHGYGLVRSRSVGSATSVLPQPAQRRR
jgi:class 3 adenylate cyclase